MTTTINKNGSYIGTTGSDVFKLNFVPKSGDSGSLHIDGQTSSLNNNGLTGTGLGVATDIDASLAFNTDRTLNLAFRPGSTTAISTFATSVKGYNAQDILAFAKSGDYSDRGAFFSNIETIQLASGVNIKLSSEIFEQIANDADRGAVNYGVIFEGVKGGKEESVTFVTQWEDAVLTVPQVGDTYLAADVQLDDYSFANLFTNVLPIYDFTVDKDDLADPSADIASYDKYVRFDGANNAEKMFGSPGVDYVTARLGNDTVFAYAGNDYLIGHGGADYLDSGDGNDLFGIGSFGTGIQGTSSKADDGKAEWIISASEANRTGVTNGITNSTDYANQIDVINGGSGFDTLRITSGIGATNSANGTVVLNDNNFIAVEKVEIGAGIARDPDESAYQFYRGHNWLAKGSSVSDTGVSAGGVAGNSLNNVVVNASGVTKHGVIFEGNANINTFIGSTKNDTFISNGGHDNLTGGAGSDQFVFQTIREYSRDGSAVNGAISYTAVDKVLSNADSDTVTDFASGVDKIVFRLESNVSGEDTFKSLVGLTKGSVPTINIQIGDLSSIDTSGTSSSFIKADTTGSDVNVYYDADGSGPGPAWLVCTLVGVNSVSASDFILASVQNF
jgi:hypothetical protein